MLAVTSAERGSQTPFPRVSNQPRESQCCVCDIRTILDKMFIKYNINEGFFNNWTVESAYFYGLFAADGGMYQAGTKAHRVSLELKNTPSERYVLNRIGELTGMTHLSERKDKPTLR